MIRQLRHKTELRIKIHVPDLVNIGVHFFLKELAITHERKDAKKEFHIY